MTLRNKKKIYILFIFIFYMFIAENISYNKYKLNMYVELSVSSSNYFLYLPIVVKAWNVIGFKCIVIVVCHIISRDILYLQNILYNLSSIPIIIKYNKSVSLHYSSKIARIFAFIANNKTNKNDYYMLSDADMIPVSKNFFTDFSYNKLIIKSFGKEGYGEGNNKGRWAMCYILGSKYTWIDILKEDIKYYYDLKEVIFFNLIHLLNRTRKYYEDYKYLDEVYMRDKIKSWSKFNSSILYHKRNYTQTRIDRSRWPNQISKINKNSIIDIHLPKLPANKNDLINIWSSTIIPLQYYIYNQTLFGLNYLNKMIRLSKIKKGKVS